MNIKPAGKTIKALLKSGRQFMIPRFQRDYGERKRVGVKKCNYNKNKLNTVLILFDLSVVLGCLIYF